MRFRKDIDAARNAADFGGGIHRAGSGFASAAAIIDGDPASGWSPDWDADPDDWFVEIDLGRGVSARRVRLVFDTTAPPFELFDLLLSTGEPAVDQVGNVVDGSLVFRTRHRVKENRRHTLTYEPESLFLTPVQFLRVNVLKAAPSSRLVAVEVESVGDNIAARLLERGGGLEVLHNVTHAREEVSLGNAGQLVDGSIFQGWNNRSEPRAIHDVWSTITLDLGAVYQIDFVRVIGAIGQGRGFNFKNYEIQSADGSIAPDGTLIWSEHFSGRSSDSNTRQGLADHLFPALPARFVRLSWLIWDAACADFFGGEGQNTKWICFASGSTQEIQVFGDGFPLEARLRSPLLDLGAAKSLNRIHWAADAPPGTGVQIRSRTGSDIIERYTYFDKNGKEISKRQWGRLIPGFRGAIDTTLIAGADWSPWSTGYAFSGQAFQSPSPRRYVELDVRLVSDSPAVAARLDHVLVDFSEPLAANAVGEIFPLEARPGIETEFSYFVRPGPTPEGFDRLSVEATAAPRFAGARLDGQAVEVAVEKIDRGFRLTFPRRIRQGQLIELRFASEVFVQSTRFEVFLEDSRFGTRIRQPVDAGDANADILSNTDVVRLPVRGALLNNLQIGPRAITPNGDGRNDALTVALDLANVLAPRPLRLHVYDLSGRAVWRQTQDITAGRHDLQWDGHDRTGRLVPPGLYLVELVLEGDARQETVRRLVAVAY